MLVRASNLKAKYMCVKLSLCCCVWDGEINVAIVAVVCMAVCVNIPVYVCEFMLVIQCR